VIVEAAAAAQRLSFLADWHTSELLAFVNRLHHRVVYEPCVVSALTDAQLATCIPMGKAQYMWLVAIIALHSLQGCLS
jgi:hypothetical protein